MRKFVLGLIFGLLSCILFTQNVMAFTDMDDVDLEFTDDAIECIAQEAIKRKTGARALRSIVEEFMLDLMYDVPSNKDMKKLKITGDMVRKKLNLAEVIKLPKEKKKRVEGEIA